MSDISKGNNMGTAQNDNAQASAPPVDHIVTTEHSAVIHGQMLDYTATAGTMVVETAGKKCEIFFTAYTVEGFESISNYPSAANRAGASDRPLTFVFNGGPGSSSEWMHMGFFGPRRIACDDNGEATQFPIVIEDNEYSILDITDLVFIDPVGTGYSRPLEGAELAHFIGYDNDNRTVGDFIRLYVTRYGRWGSPKYLSGESYGTIRARARQVSVREILAGTEWNHACFFHQRLYYYDGGHGE